jgi:hypothetical protein
MTMPALAATPTELAIVTTILGRHVPEREVWAFGSRVTAASGILLILRHEWRLISTEKYPLDTLMGVGWE